ncbi:MAG: hypothetical protein HY875_06205 [Chloroflexi bacterium]|nr:hypothetical protein [Chloroflexota bacterium]
MTTTKNSCSVCGEGLTEATSAICNSCGEPYHLNQRADIPGKDCGEVWIDEGHLALEFACNTCLNPPLEPGGLDDVLDIEEAAALAGVAAGALEAAAGMGALRHRKTGSGTYLFSRGDVMEFREGGNA